jgi:hypothetical protein
MCVVLASPQTCRTFEYTMANTVRVSVYTRYMVDRRMI